MNYIEPIATVDPVIFTIKDDKLHILIIRRTNEPFINQLALPGGFVYAGSTDGTASVDQDLDSAVRRVLFEKTGIDSPYFEQLHSFGSLTRDSRKWSISVSYVSLMDWEQVKQAQAGMHTKEVIWLPVDEVENTDFAFDHKDIINLALERLRNKVNYSSLPVHFLPETFTITQLQSVYEKILGKDIDKSAFRKKLKEMDFLERTEEKLTGIHRPAVLYKFKEDGKQCFRSNLVGF